MEHTCQNCRFWVCHTRDKSEDACGDESGDCVRYPPSALIAPDSKDGWAVSSYSPETAAADWCGEFQPKAVADRPSNLELAQELWKTAKSANKKVAIERLTNLLDSRLG